MQDNILSTYSITYILQQESPLHSALRNLYTHTLSINALTLAVPGKYSAKQLSMCQSKCSNSFAPCKATRGFHCCIVLTSELYWKKISLRGRWKSVCINYQWFVLCAIINENEYDKVVFNFKMLEIQCRSFLCSYWSFPNSSVTPVTEMASTVTLTNANDIRLISSPNWPEPYPSNTNVSITVNSPEGSMIRLTVLDLDLPGGCEDDSLTVDKGRIFNTQNKKL